MRRLFLAVFLGVLLSVAVFLPSLAQGPYELDEQATVNRVGAWSYFTNPASPMVEDDWGTLLGATVSADWPFTGVVSDTYNVSVSCFADGIHMAVVTYTVGGSVLGTLDHTACADGYTVLGQVQASGVVTVSLLGTAGGRALVDAVRLDAVGGSTPTPTPTPGPTSTPTPTPVPGSVIVNVPTTLPPVPLVPFGSNPSIFLASWFVIVLVSSLVALISGQHLNTYTRSIPWHFLLVGLLLGHYVQYVGVVLVFYLFFEALSGAFDFIGRLSG